MIGEEYRASLNNKDDSNNKRLQTMEMDEAFFEKILRRGLNDDTVSNVKIRDERPAVGKGENYLSYLSRFTLGYCTGTADGAEKLIEREIQLIVKHEPVENGPSLELIRAQNLFGTEFKAFNIILPEMERLIGQKLAPKCFYGSNNPNIIVLEDLTPLGFKTTDRQRGLSMAHVLMALDSIAKFHAASVYLDEQNPDLLKSFTFGIMSECTPKNMFRALVQTLEMVCKEIRCWPDPKYSRIADKLTARKHNFAEEVIKATKYTDKEFCVLNHGDCWMNNLMFREDNHGKPLELMLIDLQMCIYTSPVIDLGYFLSVCPEVNLKCDKDDFFLEAYLRTLTQTMTLVGCKAKPPTIEDLRKAMLKRRMWTVMTAITFYPRMITDASEVETFDKILESGETKMNIFKNPTATIALKKMLPLMDAQGYFD